MPNQKLSLNSYSNYILEDISLDIQKDLIILGSNGSGKTTLAKALCGLLEFKTNDPKLVNYIPTKLEVFDEYITVEEYLELSRFNNKVQIDEVLEILNISYLKNKPTQKISSGEAQLVLVASAMLHNSTFTIFDEPTANLDPLKTNRVFKILSSKNNIQNIVLITHDFNLAYHLEYDILYLEDGKKIFEGNSKKFFDKSNLESIFKGYVIKKDNDIITRLDRKNKDNII